MLPKWQSFFPSAANTFCVYQELGRMPAHPISFGERNTWRYLLSEIRVWMLQKYPSLSIGQNPPSGIQLRPGSPRKKGGY